MKWSHGERAQRRRHYAEQGDDSHDVHSRA
jgi:hypothetical protein